MIQQSMKRMFFRRMLLPTGIFLLGLIGILGWGMTFLAAEQSPSFAPPAAAVTSASSVPTGEPPAVSPATDEAITEAAVATAAANADAVLADWQKAVTELIAVAEKINQEPQNYHPIVTEPPHAGNDGKIVPQLILGQGISAEAVNYQLGLLGNGNEALVQAVADGVGVDTAFLISTAGFAVLADAHSAHAPAVENLHQAPWLATVANQKEPSLVTVSDTESYLHRRTLLAAPFYTAWGSFAGVVGIAVSVEDLLPQPTEETSFCLFDGQNFLVSPVGEPTATLANAWVSLPEGMRSFENLPPEVTAAVPQENRPLLHEKKLTEMPWSVLMLHLPTASSAATPVSAPAPIPEPESPAVVPATVAESGISLPHSTRIFIFGGILLGYSLLALVLLWLRASLLLDKWSKALVRMGKQFEFFPATPLSYEMEPLEEAELESLSTILGNTTDTIQRYWKDLQEQSKNPPKQIVSTAQQPLRLRESPLPLHPNLSLLAAPHSFSGNPSAFYECFITSEENLVLFIGEQETEAASPLVRLLVKTVLHSSADGHPSPARMAALLNERLTAECENPAVLHSWIGVLHLHSGILTYTNANHASPLLRHGGEGSCGELPCELSAPLSLRPDSIYGQHYLRMEPEDLLLCYPHALLQCQDATEHYYDKARLLSLLSADEKSADHLLRIVTEDLESFIGHPLPENLPLVSLQFSPPTFDAVEQLHTKHRAAEDLSPQELPYE